MDTLDELLYKFGGLNVNDSTPNEAKNKSSTQVVPNSVAEEEKKSISNSENDSKYSSAPWMKQFTFKDILLPIHDAIFPKLCIFKEYSLQYLSMLCA